MRFLLLIAALLVANVQGATKAIISSWTMTASNTDGQSEAATLLQLNSFPSDISSLASGATYMILPKYTSASVAYTVKLNAGQGVTSVSTAFAAKNGSPTPTSCSGVSTSDTVTGVSGTCSFALNTFDGSKYTFTLTFSDGTTNTLVLYIIRGHITSASIGAGGLSPVSIYPTSSGWNYAQGTSYAPSTVVYTWSYVYGPSNYGTTNTITSNTYWADTWSQTPRIKYTIDGAAKPLVDFGSPQPFTVSSCATPIIVQLYANFADGLPIFTVDYNVNVYTLIITTFQATSAFSSGSVLYASSQWNGAKYYAIAGAQVNSNGGPTSAQQCSITLGASDSYCVQTSVCKSTDFAIKDSFSGLAVTPTVSNANSGSVLCYSPAAGASFTHSIFSTLNSRTDNIEYQCQVTKASDYALNVRVFGLKNPAYLLVTNQVQTLNITNATGTAYQQYSTRYTTGSAATVTFTQPSQHVCAFTDYSPAGTAVFSANGVQGVNTKAVSTFGSADNYLTIVCVPVAISIGDPHVTGFKGQTFDIVGTPGNVYNWYSDVDFQMNVKIDRPTKAPENTTYATAVGLSFGRFGYVTMQVEPFERTTLHPRRLIRNADGTEHYVIDGFCGKLMWSKAVGGGDHHDVLHIQWQQYTINIQRRAFWDGPSKKFNYLNIQVQTTPSTAQTHGVLGQTFNLPASATESDLQGKLEDYEVKDGLLGTDYKYRVYRFDAGKFTQAQCKAGEHKIAVGSSSQTE